MADELSCSVLVTLKVRTFHQAEDDFNFEGFVVLIM